MTCCKYFSNQPATGGSRELFRGFLRPRYLITLLGLLVDAELEKDLRFLWVSAVPSVCVQHIEKQVQRGGRHNAPGSVFLTEVESQEQPPGLVSIQDSLSLEMLRTRRPHLHLEVLTAGMF